MNTVALSAQLALARHHQLHAEAAADRLAAQARPPRSARSTRRVRRPRGARPDGAPVRTAPRPAAPTR